MRESNVGFALLHPEGPGERPELREASLRMLDAASWGKPLRYLSLLVQSGKPYPRRPSMVAHKQRDQLLREMLGHPDVYKLILSNSARTVPEYATASISTRLSLASSSLWTYGRQWIDGADPTARDRWVSDVLSFATELRATHGVIPVMSAAAVMSEGSFCAVILNDVLQHPFPDEFRRMEDVHDELGLRYVRFPRWGTIYAHAHVEALGGVERIREVVAPAVIRDLGDAMYFQLTEGVATAVTPESLAKQRAFTELATPLLPPPRSA